MTPELIQRIKNCKTLPAIPALPLQVLQMCRSEDADIKKMGDLISNDPTFVAKVLNVANSSFYGGSRHKVTTVTQAITLLGMNSIATLAFCFSLYRDLRRHGASGFDHNQYWRRSLLSSVSGRVIGTWAKVIDCEEIFLAALIQDIGSLVLSETHSDVYGTIMTQADRNHTRLQEIEREKIGADHSEVGAWLAENWQLPELLQAAIRCSHDPLEMEVPEEFMPVVKTVAFSGRLADIWCDPQTEQATEQAALAAQAMLGMEYQELEVCLDSIANGFLEMSGIFQIDLGNPQEIGDILECAKRTLRTLSAGVPHPAAVS